MPAIFIGHGSPMISIEENVFVPKWRDLALSFPKPKAILCFSAHWLSRDLRVNASENPSIMYDFGGFPQELYEVKYPAQGSPELAKEVQDLIGDDRIILYYNRGLDHGGWIVCKGMYPDADIPLIQLSHC